MALRELIDAREKARHTIQNAQSELRDIEADVVEELGATKRFDLFSVNWRKLTAEVYKRGKHAKH